MGVASRRLGDHALNLGVAELQDADETLARMTQVGHELVVPDGADVKIMGCAGMAQCRAPLDVPVLEPCQAAVAMTTPLYQLETKP